MNTKLKCLLLDDELPGLTYLKMLCEQIPELEVVKAYDQPMLFLNEVHGLTFDFCILDIEMPDMSGLQIANLLGNKPVIFATAYKDYAAEAFDLNAVDYLRKPITLERLKQAVQKVSRLFEVAETKVEKSFFQWNTNKGKALLFFDKIAYIKTSESDSRDKELWMIDGDVFVLKNITFDHLVDLLPSDHFCRVNKKELISLKVVQVFSHDEITTQIFLTPGKPLRLTLGEHYRKEFLQKVSV